MRKIHFNLLSFQMCIVYESRRAVQGQRGIKGEQAGKSGGGVEAGGEHDSAGRTLVALQAI